MASTDTRFEEKLHCFQARNVWDKETSLTTNRREQSEQVFTQDSKDRVYLFGHLESRGHMCSPSKDMAECPSGPLAITHTATLTSVCKDERNSEKLDNGRSEDRFPIGVEVLAVAIEDIDVDSHRYEGVPHVVVTESAFSSAMIPSSENSCLGRRESNFCGREKGIKFDVPQKRDWSCLERSSSCTLHGRDKVNSMYHQLFQLSKPDRTTLCKE